MQDNDSADVRDRQRLIVDRAAEDIAETVRGALDDQSREGVDLPDGFSERMARAITRRTRVVLERLAFQALTDGIDRGEASASDPERETDEFVAG